MLQLPWNVHKAKLNLDNFSIIIYDFNEKTENQLSYRRITFKLIENSNICRNYWGKSEPN